MKMHGPALRRKRDAQDAPETPAELPPQKDKPTKLLEKAVSREEKLPDQELGRPKDTGRMGA